MPSAQHWLAVRLPPFTLVPVLAMTMLLFPVAFMLSPVIATLLPAMGHPYMARTWGAPMPRHPFVALASPCPEAADPYLAGDRWRRRVLDPWCWRSDHYRSAIVWAAARGDDATAKNGRDGQGNEDFARCHQASPGVNPMPGLDCRLAPLQTIAPSRTLSRLHRRGSENHSQRSPSLS